jgi:hypothetical protein
MLSGSLTVNVVCRLAAMSAMMPQDSFPEARVESQSRSTSRAPSIAPRMGIIALSLVIGVLVGYWVYTGSHTNLDRSREADLARWQGQADLYLNERAPDHAGAAVVPPKQRPPRS